VKLTTLRQITDKDITPIIRYLTLTILAYDALIHLRKHEPSFTQNRCLTQHGGAQ
jgi:hypothetical protein